MAVGMVRVKPVDRDSAYIGDKSAPKISYLDYYDAACLAKERKKEDDSGDDSSKENVKGSRFAQSVDGMADSWKPKQSHVETAKPEQQTDVKPQHSMTYREMLACKINEILEKIEAGAIKPSFPIGAAYFTLKEWELFLEAFDKIQEEMKKEAGQEVPPEDTSVTGREKFGIQKELASEPEDPLLRLLSEHTICSYPPEREEEDGAEYCTYYSKEGIYCKKTDSSGYEWEIRLTEESQYERIIEFLNHFTRGENLRFGCHKNFWQDFLDGTLDQEGFLEFMNQRVRDGVPNYLDENENGMWVNKEAVKYAKYMNEPGLFRVYGKEELANLALSPVKKI